MKDINLTPVNQVILVGKKKDGIYTAKEWY